MGTLAIIAVVGFGHAAHARVADDAAKDPLPSSMTRAPTTEDAPPPTTTATATAATATTSGEEAKLAEDQQSVHMRLRKLAVHLADAFKKLPGEGRYQTVAVLPFTATTDELVQAGAPSFVAADLATFLKRDGGLELVERQEIEHALAESYLSELGVTDANTAVKLGELLAAQALVVGEVSQAGDQVVVNARVLSTESGKVFVADQATMPASSVVAVAASSDATRTPWGAAFRSALIPGWGQLANDEPTKGFVVLGLASTAVLSAASLQAIGAVRHEEYRKSGDASLLDGERNLYIGRNVALVAVAGVWTYGVVDAFINGAAPDPAVAP